MLWNNCNSWKCLRVLIHSSTPHRFHLNFYQVFYRFFSIFLREYVVFVLRSVLPWIRYNHKTFSHITIEPFTITSTSGDFFFSSRQCCITVNTTSPWACNWRSIPSFSNKCNFTFYEKSLNEDKLTVYHFKHFSENHQICWK